MKDPLFLVLGLGFLILGSHWLVRSLQFFSFYFKWKPLFLSIVVLGFVSSSPECFVTINAGLKGLSDAALGNILGSNIINILLVLSLTGLFYSFSPDKQVSRFDMPALILGILALGLFFIDQIISRWEALLLLGFFAFYLKLLFRKRKTEEALPLKKEAPLSILKAGAYLIFGFAFLFIGSSWSVDSSLNIVKALSLSERFAGVFILSLSTSLPELVTSFQAVLKKEGGMALGNIIGSNLFNTLFILGSASALKPLHFSTGIYADYFFMLAVTLFLSLSFFIFKSIPKIIFGGFIISYFVYILFVSGSL